MHEGSVKDLTLNRAASGASGEKPAVPIMEKKLFCGFALTFIKIT
jgi:hypothetical protein